MSASATQLVPHGSVAYINGSVYTVDNTQPWAEGFIVSPNGTFTTVGLTQDIEDTAKSQDLIVVNLHQRFVMPGIHDAHVHTFHSGLHLLSDILLGLDTTNNTVEERMKTGFEGCAYHHTYSDWIIGVLDHIENYDRSMLDDNWPDNPVLIHGGGGHIKYLNTLGLEKAGFNIQAEPDADRTILIRREDGSLTGEIGGQEGMGRVSTAVPRPTLAHVKRALKRAVTELHRNGVTSCQEAAANSLLLEALHEMDTEGDLTMDYSTHILYKNEWLSGEILRDPEELIKSADKYRSKHVDTRFVKFMMDGTPVSSIPTEAGLDKAGKPDLTKVLQPDIEQLVEKWDRKGMTCKIHCTGAGATRMALDAVSKVRAGNPKGPQHEIAHCVGVQNDDYPRFRALNVTAEMSPAMHFNMTLPYETLGWNFAKMVESENLVTIGSDWAFGMHLPLFPSVANVVNQTGAETMLEMLTLNGAKSTGKQQASGSITPGKVASFITVDRDLTKGDFANAQILQTWFEGEIVFDSTGTYQGKLKP